MSIKRLTTALLVVAFAATPALAHPGHHETMGFWVAVEHLLGSYDHLLTGVLALAIAAFGGRVLWRALTRR